MKNIYIGNLPPSLSESNIRDLFKEHGAVISVKLIKDQFTERPRGFGFVEMTNDNEAAAAIAALNGTEIDGRALKVTESKPREEKGSRGSGSKPKLW